MIRINDATILAIDDEPINLMFLDEYLGYLCKQLILQSNIEMALTLARKKQPNVILLDIVMRDMNGYEVCQQLKADDTTQHIPIIFLSSLSETADKVHGFQVGGVDYISKPFIFEEMHARIESCLRLHSQIRQVKQEAVDKENASRLEQIAFYKLSDREIKILTLYAGGHTYSEIAKQLYVTEHTIKWHLRNIFEKLDVKNRSQAIKKAYAMGLLDYGS